MSDVVAGISGAVEIGRSASAVTYRGTDASGRTVILKVLQRDASPEVRQRFDYDQARLAELADHPDIVVTLDHGYTDGNQPYTVMEELTGGSLADKVGSGMDGPAVIAVGVKLAGALESAHRRNLIHGDLRPEDVLITDDGEPHVADLGVALVTGIGPDRSTDPTRIAHAAPEQLETHLPTTATDVYALGSVLHAVLGGAPAFLRPGDVTAIAVAARIAREPVPDLRSSDVPAAVVDVIEKAMAKNPADRYESAEAMGHALQQAEVTLGLPITPMNVVGMDLTPKRPEPLAPEGPPPGAAGPGPGGPAAPGGSGSGGGSRKGLLIGLGALAVAAVVAIGFVVLGGGDDGGDDPPPFERGDDEEQEVAVDLTDVQDDDQVITVGTIDRWSDVNGANLTVEGVTVQDVIAAESVAEFQDDVGTSGVEVTFFPADAVAGAGLPTDADALLDFRTGVRGLADACSRDLEPQDLELAGFSGLSQRFEECGGASLVVFAGFDDAGNAVTVEVHLVDEDDEAAVDDVLESVEIAR